MQKDKNTAFPGFPSYLEQGILTWKEVLVVNIATKARPFLS
jgi:hypothetical protein